MSLKVVVEVREEETGVVLFIGKPVDESDYLIINRESKAPTRLLCSVPSLDASLAAVAGSGEAGTE